MQGNSSSKQSMPEDVVKTLPDIVIGENATADANPHTPNEDGVNEAAEEKDDSNKGLSPFSGLRRKSHSVVNGLRARRQSSIIFTAEPDPGLIMGMERTLFRALDNAWIIAITGIGLMSVGANESVTNVGAFVVVLSMITAIIAFGMHFYRIALLARFKPFRYFHTILWATILVFITFITMGLELRNGILYPYLDRGKAVTFV